MLSSKMPSAQCSKLSRKYFIPILWKVVYCADGNGRYMGTEGEPRRDPGLVGWWSLM